MWWFYNWVDTLCSQMLLIIIQMLAQTLLYSSQLKSVLLPQLSPSFGETSLGYCFLGAGSLLCVTTRVIAELNLWFFSLSHEDVLPVSLRSCCCHWEVRCLPYSAFCRFLLFSWGFCVSVLRLLGSLAFDSHSCMNLENSQLLPPQICVPHFPCPFESAVSVVLASPLCLILFLGIFYLSLETKICLHILYFIITNYICFSSYITYRSLGFIFISWILLHLIS